MTEQRFEELSMGYVLGSQGAEERLELEAYLAVSPEHEARLRELVEAFHSIPEALTSEEPPAHLKNEILDEISKGKTERSSLGGAGIWRPWALAASVLVTVVGFWSFRLLDQNRDQERQISFLSSEVQQLRDLNQGFGVRIQQLSDPRTRFLTLAGLSGFEGASGSAFLFPADGKARLYLHNLPGLAANQDFQLWVIEEGQPPYPSQVFQPVGGVTEFEIDLPINADRVQVLAVTIEPTGGSPGPTGSMVLAGQS